MVPRGEVGLVIAALALTSGVFAPSLYGAVLMMVAVTTLFAPLAIGPAFGARLPGKAPPRGAEEIT
jgi:hypothetical protein